MLPIRRYIEWDILRYIHYGWGNSIIQSLIFRRHGVKLGNKCIDHLRSNTPCSKRCMENCVLKRYIEE